MCTGFQSTAQKSLRYSEFPYMLTLIAEIPEKVIVYYRAKRNIHPTLSWYSLSLPQ